MVKADGKVDLVKYLVDQMTFPVYENSIGVPSCGKS